MSERYERWLIRGRVQGVYFRAFTRERARSLGVCGWVRNLPDGRVEAQVAATAEVLAELERELRQGPPVSRVDGIDRTEIAHPATHPRGFEIRRTP
jgi:acylphosphatase